MTTWIIEPRDPLIVRDGRPFGLIPGARARSLGFPFPSTTTGALRTRSWQDSDGVFSPADRNPAELLQVSVRGPLLVELDAAGEINEWYAPAPLDALPTELDTPREGWLRRVPLAPLDVAADLTNLSDGLAPVGPREIDPRKPYGRAPRYWRWSAPEPERLAEGERSEQGPERLPFAQWLLGAKPDGAEGVAADELGVRGLEQEWRTHVRIERERQAAAEGMLFQTNGLEFTTKARGRLALALVSDGQVAEGLGPVGGERRLAAWRKSAKDVPACPDELIDDIVRAKACRLLLLTPAHFAQGYRPTTLLQGQHGVTPGLIGAIVGRPAIVSGWDYVANGPKPARRLAPAGSVYFLKLGDATEDAIRAWVQDTWLHCVSDDAQARADGFGLAALGAWSGVKMNMEAKHETAA